MALKIRPGQIYQKLVTIGRSASLAWFRGRKLEKAQVVRTRRRSLSQRLKQSRVLRRITSKINRAKPGFYKTFGLLERKKRTMDRRCQHYLQLAVTASLKDKPDEFIQAIYRLRKQVGKRLALQGKVNSLEDFANQVGHYIREAPKEPQFLVYFQKALRKPGSSLNKLDASLRDCFEAMMEQRDINPNQMMMLTSARAVMSEMAYQGFDDQIAFEQWCQMPRQSAPETMAEINKALASIH
ncbi:hypothetical protein [Endozoicomonas arenosclerae]|uniref:hypothetical protein n=1 Tax=Endozoicomonas arenosclerae TaxID=1633495 RepID=UPI0007813029|nr:hypothetical protein [Endozoicomonas arenosclerae]